MMNRAKYFLLAMLPLGAACYDAGDVDNCVGFECPVYGFNKPEGGHIALEYIGLPDGTDIRRAFTYLQSDQTPDFIRMPRAGECIDYTKTDAWPVAQGTNRVYMDLGSQVKMKASTGLELTLARAEGADAWDFWEREHDIAYKYFSAEGSVEDEMFNTYWSVALENDELGINGELENRIYMPRVFTPTEPEFPTLVSFSDQEDFVFNWKSDESAMPEYDGLMGSFVLFLDWNFATIAMCMQRDVGRLTIPKGFVPNLPPDGGVLQLGVLYDKPILTDEGRLIHVTGLSCLASPYEIAQ
jgi:hypothetical protein